eukprot:TRINITY_DN54134_c0_g1_i1.p1 TRINITY_DN54134_c0_g1~~TRINITY_DN54134_c0_g1_i1.p1  ORF type:complete len:279 (-),score=38.00 TRINITY_DN54134_c0_g1_i1:59-895(-)
MARKRTHLMICVPILTALLFRRDAAAFFSQPAGAFSSAGTPWPTPKTLSCRQRPSSYSLGRLRSSQILHAGAGKASPGVDFSGRRVAAIVLMQAVACSLAALLLKVLQLPGEKQTLSLPLLLAGVKGTPTLFLLFLILPSVLRLALPERFPLKASLDKLWNTMTQVVLLQFGSSFRPLAVLLSASAVGITAGLWEELLFRGVLQSIFPQRWAIALAAVLFGACHAITPLYFIAATLAGLHLGYLFSATKQLAVPIVAHALYDIVALFVLHVCVSRSTK